MNDKSNFSPKKQCWLAKFKQNLSMECSSMVSAAAKFKQNFSMECSSMVSVAALCPTDLGSNSGCFAGSNSKSKN